MKISKKDRTIELLEELVKWTKVTSIPHVRALLLDILETAEEKIAYQGVTFDDVLLELGQEVFPVGGLFAGSEEGGEDACGLGRLGVGRARSPMMTAPFSR